MDARLLMYAAGLELGSSLARETANGVSLACHTCLFAVQRVMAHTLLYTTHMVGSRSVPTVRAQHAGHAEVKPPAANEREPALCSACGGSAAAPAGDSTGQVSDAPAARQRRVSISTGFAGRWPSPGDHTACNSFTIKIYLGSYGSRARYLCHKCILRHVCFWRSKSSAAGQHSR